MEKLLKKIRSCDLCAKTLPFEPRPLLSVSRLSKILIIGQAPGIKAHESQKTWNDASGRNLMRWLGVDASSFYDPEQFGMMPMAFCYPGKSKTGDLPPPKACAPLWHEQIRNRITQTKLILLIGKHAQDYYLNNTDRKSLTDRVRNFKEYRPQFFPLPHPSPRNNIWMRKNPWFEQEVLPQLKLEITKALSPEKHRIQPITSKSDPSILGLI